MTQSTKAQGNGIAKYGGNGVSGSIKFVCGDKETAEAFLPAMKLPGFYECYRC